MEFIFTTTLYLISVGIFFSIGFLINKKFNFSEKLRNTDLCDVIITPVTGDDKTRELIKSSLGFDTKYMMLTQKMQKLIKPYKFFLKFW